MFDCSRQIHLILLTVLTVSFLGIGWESQLVPTAAGGPAAAVRADEDPHEAFNSYARQQLTLIVDDLEETGDFERATGAIDELLDQVIAYASLDQRDLFRDVAMHHRLIWQLGVGDDDVGLELVQFFRSSPKLAYTLPFLVDTAVQDPADVYGLLNDLRETFGDQPLERFASLTAAICVVHDRPFTRRVNENRVSAPEPAAIFHYFASNEQHMLFGLRDVPAELLLYVVDVTGHIGELEWALRRYRGDQRVGERFFDIDYDYDHWDRDQEKAVTRFGLTLPNVLEYGGVCADQAYFAMNVGKAIGVPTAYVSGRGRDTSHAWVGFLESDGRHAWWNFDVGRYEAYQNVRGVLLNPQSRSRIEDSLLGMLGEGAVATTPRERQQAAALREAAARLRDFGTSDELDFDPPTPELDLLPEPQIESPDIAHQLTLIEAALRTSPADLGAWQLLRDAAEADDLSFAQKREWAGVIYRLCGDRYFDFQVDMLRPMIESTNDLDRQNRLWNQAYERYRRRIDLAAELRLKQGHMWRRNGEHRRAGECYYYVVENYINGGPHAVRALQLAARQLERLGRERDILPMYQEAWSAMETPDPRARRYMRQSNWYRVGTAFVRRLENAGHRAQAAEIRQLLQSRAVVSQ